MWRNFKVSVLTLKSRVVTAKSWFIRIPAYASTFYGLGLTNRKGKQASVSVCLASPLETV